MEEEVLVEKLFKDASNTENGSTQPWISQGGAKVDIEPRLIHRDHGYSERTTVPVLLVNESVTLTEETQTAKRLTSNLNTLKDACKDQGRSIPTAQVNETPAPIQTSTATLVEEHQDEVVAHVDFDCDVGLSFSIPKLSDCLLYGSIAGYLGYRIFNAFRS
ncbi:hypothetical protein MMC34_002755 [Xylographa carneopallida]|nr:hypothetical protein [Xylographa carneopallida]